jgi:hypothetical protein
MSVLRENTKLEVLNDHYKDTYKCIEDLRNRRDKYLLYILVVIIFMLFQLIFPKDAEETISQLIISKLSIANPIDVSFLISVIWLIMAALEIRYFQTIIQLERQYDYFHHLENVISKIYRGNAFTREGTTYLSTYCLFSNWAWFIFTILFPVLFLMIIIITITTEILLKSITMPLLIFNIVFAVIIFITAVLFFISLHFKK